MTAVPGTIRKIFGAPGLIHGEHAKIGGLNKAKSLCVLLHDICVCLIDLTDERSFRDLSKPIGALTEERLERLRVRLFCLL